MAYLVGLVLGFAVCLFGALAGFDKDRAFYSTLTIVIASYYVLFAVMGDSSRAVLLESGVMFLFVGASVLAFKGNMWIAVAALFIHGVSDFFHGQVIRNSGVPVWWPMFCGTFDVVAAAFLALRLVWGSAGNDRDARGARSTL